LVVAAPLAAVRSYDERSRPESTGSHGDHGTHLDGAVHEHRAALGPLDRLLEAVHVDLDEAAELLARLGEGAVADDRPVAAADGPRGVRAGERVICWSYSPQRCMCAPISSSDSESNQPSSP
jgi:hypothetical protein